MVPTVDFFPGVVQSPISKDENLDKKASNHAFIKFGGRSPGNIRLVPWLGGQYGGYPQSSPLNGSSVLLLCRFAGLAVEGLGGTNRCFPFQKHFNPQRPFYRDWACLVNYQEGGAGCVCWDSSVSVWCGEGLLRYRLLGLLAWREMKAFYP